MSQPRLSYYERGKREPDAGTALTLALLYGIPLERLFRRHVRSLHAHVRRREIYALALARRTGLPLRLFKCGWFDEMDYFEFYPLQAVYRLRQSVGSRASGVRETLVK